MERDKEMSFFVGKQNEDIDILLANAAEKLTKLGLSLTSVEMDREGRLVNAQFARLFPCTKKED